MKPLQPTLFPNLTPERVSLSGRPALYPDGAGWKEPTTSRESAETVDTAKLRNDVRAMLKEHGPLSADQCAALLNESVLSIRPRFSELVARGEIEDTGARRANWSKKRAKVWRLTNTVAIQEGTGV